MSEEGGGPKLLTKKPKKSQVKQYQDRLKQHQQIAKEFSSPPPSSSSSTSSSAASAAAASYQMGSQSQSQSQSPPPPPQPPKESFGRRYKFLWPLLLTVNLGVGAYLFMRTKKKDTGNEEEVAIEGSSGPASTIPVTKAVVTEESLPPQPPVVPVRPREPIPENQQRELFKWILEEKRKVKPKDPEERKRLDEEKAILKQFIRGKSIPPV